MVVLNRTVTSSATQTTEAGSNRTRIVNALLGNPPVIHRLFLLPRAPRSHSPPYFTANRQHHVVTLLAVTVASIQDSHSFAAGVVLPLDAVRIQQLPSAAAAGRLYTQPFGQASAPLDRSVSGRRSPATRIPVGLCARESGRRTRAASRLGHRWRYCHGSRRSFDGTQSLEPRSQNETCMATQCRETKGRGVQSAILRRFHDNGAWSWATAACRCCRTFSIINGSSFLSAAAATAAASSDTDAGALQSFRCITASISCIP